MKKIETKRSKKDLYSFILRKIIEGSSQHLTNKEYSIMQCIYNTNYEWDTQALKKELIIDTYSLNNYKRFLLKKGLLVRSDSSTFIHPNFRLNLDQSPIEIKFIIHIEEDSPKETPKAIL